MIEDLTRHGIAILLLISEQGRVMVSDARRLGMGYATFYKNIRWLLEVGLIEEAREGVRRQFRLTDLGVNVALKLKEIDELLQTGTL